MPSVRKDLKKVLQESEKQGWRVVKVKMGYQLMAPDGINIVTIHHTPSSHRSLDNYISDMRKRGFVWKGR